jgi:hypothetical protein
MQAFSLTHPFVTTLILYDGIQENLSSLDELPGAPAGRIDRILGVTHQVIVPATCQYPTWQIQFVSTLSWCVLVIGEGKITYGTCFVDAASSLPWLNIFVRFVVRAFYQGKDVTRYEKIPSISHWMSQLQQSESWKANEKICTAWIYTSSMYYRMAK